MKTFAWVVVYPYLKGIEKGGGKEGKKGGGKEGKKEAKRRATRTKGENCSLKHYPPKPDLTTLR